MSIIRRLLPIAFLLAGLGSLLYGALFHVVTVEEEKEREISIMVPAPFGPGEAPGERREEAPPSPPPMPPADGDPFQTPPPGAARDDGAANPFENHAPLLPPGMKLEKVTEKYVESGEDPEWVIIREVTFGGVVRLANGTLKRTYSGKPPALCPS